MSNVNQLKRIHEFARERSIPFAVVLIPDENQLNSALQDALIAPGDRERYDFGQPQRTLSELLAQAQLPVLDLLPAFQTDSRCLYMDDTHWVAEGHAFAAERIATWLSAQQMLP